MRRSFYEMPCRFLRFAFGGKTEPVCADFCIFANAMKRIITYIFALAAGTVSAGAQTMEKLFSSMPDSIVPVMSKNNRLDCIDFYKSNMKSNVQNLFGGKSSISEMTDDYIKLLPTASSQTEIKILATTGGEKLIMVAYTFAAPGKETTMAFYTPQWQRLKTSDYMEMPQAGEFFAKNDTANEETAEKAKNLISAAFVCAKVDKQNGNISFGLSTEGFSTQEQETAKPFIAPDITYAWNGKRYARQ